MKTEFSRLLIKRSTQTGEQPTINTGSTTPTNGWSSTDVMVGEFFLNAEDDLIWIRTNNGVIQIPTSLSGVTNITDFCGVGITTDSIASCDGVNTITLILDDTVGEFSIDSIYNGVTVQESFLIKDNALVNITSSNNSHPSIIIGSKNGTINSGNTNSVLLGGDDNTINSSKASIIGGDGNTILTGSIGSSIVGTQNGQISGNYSFIGGGYNTQLNNYSNYSFGIGGQDNNMNYSVRSGLLGGINNIISSGNTDSIIMGGNGNSIAVGLTNVAIIGGTSISATTSNTTYVDRLNVNTIGSGTPVTNLAVDVNGNVVSGTSVSGSSLAAVLGVGNTTSGNDIIIGTDKITYVTDIEEFGYSVTSPAATNTTYTVATLSSTGDTVTIEMLINGSDRGTDPITDPRMIGGSILGTFRHTTLGVLRVGTDNIVMNRSTSSLDYYFTISGSDIQINFDNSALATDPVYWITKIKRIYN